MGQYGFHDNSLTADNVLTVKTNKRGSDCTGSDGAKSRTLVLPNMLSTAKLPLLVFVQGLFLHSSDYSIEHKDENSVITFTNEIDNVSYITIVHGG